MQLNSSSVLKFALLFTLVIVDVVTFTQDEINAAWKKMESKETFFARLYDQFGCWPQNVVPYVILPGFTQEQKNHIIEDIYHIQNRTCLRWEKKQYIKGVHKHVEFFHHNKFSCYTGEYGAPNEPTGIKVRIHVHDICFKTKSIIHEMLHALGFLHEQQRIDRDCYVAVNETYAGKDYNFKIAYDDLAFERWPYDKRSIMQYSRLPEDGLSTDYVIKDKDEPFHGLIYRHRLGQSEGPLGFLQWKRGTLTKLDAYKINYRFCGAPDFCDTQPKMCKDIEEEEKWAGCKQLYMEIAEGKVKPTN